MIVVGIAMVWWAYTLGFTGYSWVRGYDLSIGQIVSPVGYYKGPWPPPMSSNTVIIPNGSTQKAQQDKAKQDAATKKEVKGIQKATRDALRQRGSTHGGVQ